MMKNLFLTNYTEQTFLERIKENLRSCKSFEISVSFIKKAGLVLLSKDIEAALARGAEGKIITSTYQNFTDVESLRTFMILMDKYSNFKCHLDFESFHDDGYMTIGYHSKGYYFEFEDDVELIVGSSNITRYALLKNVEWDLVIRDNRFNPVF
jgi:HKD family nuclease